MSDDDDNDTNPIEEARKQHRGYREKLTTLRHREKRTKAAVPFLQEETKAGVNAIWNSVEQDFRAGNLSRKAHGIANSKHSKWLGKAEKMASEIKDDIYSEYRDKRSQVTTAKKNTEREVSRLVFGELYRPYVMGDADPDRAAIRDAIGRLLNAKGMSQKRTEIRFYAHPRDFPNTSGQDRSEVRMAKSNDRAREVPRFATPDDASSLVGKVLGSRFKARKRRDGMGLMGDFSTILGYESATRILDDYQEPGNTWDLTKQAIDAGAMFIAVDKEEPAVHVLLPPEEAHVQWDEATERWQFHSEEGPALVFRNGDDSYYWRDVEVPAWVITEPEGRETLDTALHHNNAEVRRAAAEAMGWDTIVEKVPNQNIISEDEDREGNPRRVLEIELAPRRSDVEEFRVRERDYLQVVLLHVTDPSTGDEYHLRLPPDAAEERWTPKQGVAWTFGKDVDEYELEAEA